MRILNVNMTAAPEVNLGPIRMDNLGHMIVIAGRNGAGKSRLLRQIAKWAYSFSPESTIVTQINSIEHAISSNPTLPGVAGWRSQLLDLLKALRIRQQLIISEDKKPVIVPFVPARLDLTDPNNYSRTSILQAVKQLETPGVDNLPQGTFSLIQHLQDRHWEATHPKRTLADDQANLMIHDYERMTTLVKRFLNTDITRSPNSEAQLFQLPLGESALSDGQKVILQLCAAIYAQGASLNDIIIFMDVPENHLHPSALLDVVKTVSDQVGKGQLWIATHSIPLLANVDSSSIWWMESNTISKAGGKPELVLTGLLGDEERRGKLASFLDLPFALASDRFTAECLVPPGVTDFKTSDPQTDQIRTLLEQIRKGTDPLRILDFGAGKGRLASELAEKWDSEEERRQLDYIAYDSSKKDADECASAIARLHGDADNRLFHDATVLRAHYDEGSFHVVVMCNVLHEISPADWNDLFGPKGKITRLLRPDGFLLVVEVQQLPYGERAHQNGFLVLDGAQLRKLFAIGESDSSGFVVDARRDDWLKAHLISQPLLARFSSTTREAALKDLSSTARDRIRELQQKEANYRNGRLYGFWVQQFANAELALS
jgi:SAM-dependent methyltransferase